MSAETRAAEEADGQHWEQHHTCPQCVRDGERSTVHDPATFSETCMGFFPYRDEEGHYHSHNPNMRESFLTCSRGHRWRLMWGQSCASCGWTRGPTLLRKAP